MKQHMVYLESRGGKKGLSFRCEECGANVFTALEDDGLKVKYACNGCPARYIAERKEPKDMAKSTTTICDRCKQPVMGDTEQTITTSVRSTKPNIIRVEEQSPPVVLDLCSPCYTLFAMWLNKAS